MRGIQPFWFCSAIPGTLSASDLSENIHRRDFNRALMVWIRNLTPDTQAILRAEQHKTWMKHTERNANARTLFNWGGLDRYAVA
jgi:hypothetical protein